MVMRLALVENEHRIRQAARNVKKFFQEAGVTGPDDGNNVIDLKSHR
jgi:alanine-synthesizing transaminase